MLRLIILAAMIAHKFVTSGSTLNNLVYRTVFTNEAELEVPLLQPSLFSIHRKPLSYSREDLSAQMVVHPHHADSAASPLGAPDAPYYVSASYYPNQGGSSSSTAYDASEWGRWE